jgi:hypothetical protein
MKLSDALNKEITTTTRRKKTWVIFALIAAANGFTSGLMGFPDLNVIAHMDGMPINHFWFSLTERICMMIASGFMMLPFFQQLFKSNVYQTYHERSLSRTQEIRKNSALGKALANSQKAGSLYMASLFLASSLAIITSYVISSIVLHHILNMPLIALCFAGVILIHQIATYTIKRYIKKQVSAATLHTFDITLSHKEAKEKVATAIARFVSQKRTETIIRKAILQLRSIKFVKPSEEELRHALIKTIYAAQLERFRTQISQGGKLSPCRIEYLKQQYASDSDYYTILDHIRSVDSMVMQSPLLQFEAEMLMASKREEQIDKATLYQDLHNFRQWAVDNAVMISEATTYLSTQGDKLSKWSRKAIEAEIAEEKRLDNQKSPIATRQKAMLNRCIARSDAETARLQAIQAAKQPWWKFAYLGNTLGIMNAVVNAIINGAVSGKIILLILPVVFGLSITNPILLYTIISATCIAGFTSSFLITRQSIVGVFRKIDEKNIRNRLIKKPLSLATSSWWLTPLVAVAATGLGILSGMQVYYILMIYLPGFALAASLIVGAISFIAIFSLFLDYARASLDQQQKTQDFLEIHFPAESQKAQAAHKIYRQELIASVAASIAIGLLLWQWFPQHIVMVSLVALASFCATWILIGTGSNDLYQKSGINRLNMIAKWGFSITLLYCICLMMAVSLGIYSIPLLSGNMVGTLVALSVSTIVAGLYFPYVWNTATSPDINLPVSIIDTADTDSKPKTPLIVRHPLLISLAISLIVFASVWYCTITLLPNIYGIVLAIAMSITTSYYCIKDILHAIKQHQQPAISYPLDTLPPVNRSTDPKQAAKSPRSITCSSSPTKGP